MPPIKGTYVRNAWDWYKNSAAIAHDFVSLAANTHQTFAFQNDQQPGSILELFRLEIDAQGANTIDLWTAKLDPTFTPDAGGVVYPLLNTENAPLASWAVSTGAIHAGTPFIINGRNITDSATIELASGGPFIRLAQGYALFVDVATGANSPNVNVNIWFQQVQM